MLRALVFAGLLLSACGDTASPPAVASTPVAPAAPAAPPTAASLAILAAADAGDGKVDKVIDRCVSCQLHMPGKAEHASTHGEYTVHSCSSSCKQRFDADPAGLLAAIPGDRLSAPPATPTPGEVR